MRQHHAGLAKVLALSSSSCKCYKNDGKEHCLTTLTFVDKSTLLPWSKIRLTLPERQGVRAFCRQLLITDSALPIGRQTSKQTNKWTRHRHTKTYKIISCKVFLHCKIHPKTKQTFLLESSFYYQQFLKSTKRGFVLAPTIACWNKYVYHTQKWRELNVYGTRAKKVGHP